MIEQQLEKLRTVLSHLSYKHNPTCNTIYEQIEPYLNKDVKSFYQNNQNQCVVEDRGISCSYIGNIHEGELNNEVYKKFAGSIEEFFSVYKPIGFLILPFIMDLIPCDSGKPKCLLLAYFYILKR